MTFFDVRSGRTWVDHKKILNQLFRKGCQYKEWYSWVTSCNSCGEDPREVNPDDVNEQYLEKYERCQKDYAEQLGDKGPIKVWFRTHPQILIPNDLSLKTFMKLL